MDILFKYLVVLSNFTHNNNNNNNKASLLRNFPSSRMFQVSQFSWLFTLFPTKNSLYIDIQFITIILIV